MLNQFNQILQKWMPLITPASVVIGIVFYESLDNYMFLVPWIFAVMTFTGSLRSNFHDLKKVFQHPLPLLVALLTLHLVMPLIAFGTGTLFFHDDPYIVTGLILAFVIPTGITSLLWVTIYQGNVVLTLSIILVDTLLSPIIVPAMLQWLVGSSVEMDVVAIMNGLLWMIVIPSLLGMITNQYLEKSKTEKLTATLSPFSKLGIGAVVAINSSGIAPYVTKVDTRLLSIIVVVFLLALAAYGIGWISGKMLKTKRSTTISMMYNSGMRNISAGAVIAITYFPAPVAIPVIVGMLFQQVLASLVGSVLDKRKLPLNTDRIVSR
jgi:bile acid:Na+ symporter, BASS family